MLLNRCSSPRQHGPRGGDDDDDGHHDEKTRHKHTEVALWWKVEEDQIDSPFEVAGRKLGEQL